MTYSIEDAKEYVQENLADIMATYENYPDLPAWAKAFERTKQMWQAGCWLLAQCDVGKTRLPSGNAIQDRLLPRAKRRVRRLLEMGSHLPE